MRGTSIMDGAPKHRQRLLARALYDNHPDCSDELAFSRGDILTILEQDMPESEGWWRCLLHGRQGLAPANRLQILPEAPADRLCPPLPRGPDEALESSEETYQVPSLLHPLPEGPVYEQMKGWVEGPLPLTDQVYEFPDPPTSARIICEKTLSFPRQALFTLPRPAWASLPVLPSQVYDVPAQSRVFPAQKEPEKQQLYDILPSPQKAGWCHPASQAHEPSTALTPTIALKSGGSHSLPSPRKSEWVYDNVASPGKAGGRNPPLRSLVEEPGPRVAPGPAGCRARSLPPQPYGMERKLSLPEVPPPDSSPSGKGAGYQVPPSFLSPRVEQQSTKPNIYDIPKAMPGAQQAEKELGGAKEAPEAPLGQKAAWISRWAASPPPEADRRSIASADSRASVVSSCSSMSTDESAGSSSEEPARELPLDLDLARETIMALQHKVVSSTAGLMLFVSRKWRFRDYLEANIGAIRRAAEHTEVSLREFLEFAREVCGMACNLTDSNLHARIREQLQTISSSYEILLEAKGSLDSCDWSLDVLVTDKVQNSLDDLERFVMVARMVPEDIKRFASMVIANGRLLFKQNCKKVETTQLTTNAECKCEQCIQLPQRETDSYQRSLPFNEPRENEHCPDLLEKDGRQDCGQLSNLEEKEKPTSEQRLNENKDSGGPGPGSLSPQPPSERDPSKKLHLSEHCRLYFGALFKALGVFHSSLRHSPPPETFITQSKLIVMAGQKLVDALCRETQEKDLRDRVLRSSCRLCGLLKALALATKDAVLQYPSPAALGRLRAEAERLEQHTRQFRGTLE
nr:cas scaffolding protein family member 4 isoform X2 [Oryctolagus cuniculus]